MKSKIISMIAVAILSLSLTACGKQEGTNSEVGSVKVSIKDLQTSLVGKKYESPLSDDLILKYGTPQTLAGTSPELWVGYFPKGDFTVIQPKADSIITEVLEGKQPREEASEENK